MVEANITLYELAGMNGYEPIPLSELQDDTGFNKCNKYLRSC